MAGGVGGARSSRLAPRLGKFRALDFLQVVLGIHGAHSQSCALESERKDTCANTTGLDGGRDPVYLQLSV